LNEQEVKFCLKCGTRLARLERFSRLRPACPACGWVYFPDPKVAVAVIVIQMGRVLLVSRLNEPHQGKWSLPAGFLDAGEDPAAAAARECLEETGLTIRVNALFDMLAGRSHRHGADILMVYLADVVSGKLCAGDDAGQAAFFSFNHLPELAFKSTSLLLEKYQTLRPGT
jgi:8-oxo-dGTP diphosphatase